MPIRVSCPSCGKQFSAWDDLKGKAVECPKCHQRVVVPARASAAGKSHDGAAAKASDRPAAPKPRKLAPQASRRKGVALTPKPPKKQPATAPESAPNAKRQPHRPPAADDFDDSDALPIVCPNCRAGMAADDDLCDSCGYHKILKKVIDLDGVRRRESTTGFERIVKQQLHTEETAGSALLWMKILAGFMTITVCMICLGRWWWIGFGVIAVAYAVYHFRTKARQASAGQEAINQDPFSLAIWNSLLVTQRRLGWRKLEWPFPSAPSLLLRDAEFADDDLAELEHLDEIAALDLEGTQIGNRGLVHLAEYKQLEFLVLRRTNVTIEGVRRLQSALPKTWIWT